VAISCLTDQSVTTATKVIGVSLGEASQALNQRQLADHWVGIV